MKKLVKFTTKEVVKEVEKEIELPAYFCMGNNLPSKTEYGEYFSSMVKISDPDKRGISISAGHNLLGDRANFYSFDRSFRSNAEVVEKWKQVPESEWLKAVEYVKRDIDN